jgi:hypothetical protein
MRRPDARFLSLSRGEVCPSCGARRMSQTAAHLLDHVIPHVPVRQWMLSLPIALRMLQDQVGLKAAEGDGQIPPVDPTVATYRRRLSSVVLS